MTVTRVGAASTTANNTGTLTAAYSQAPTAGNLLTMGVSVVSDTSSTCTTPTGWTAGPVGGGYANLEWARIFLFWKVATGSDAAPSLTFNQAPNYGGKATIEEWASSTGWSGSPHDADSAVGVNNQNSTAAGTCDSGPVTTTAPGFVWSFMGAFVSAAKTLTWGGGSVSSSGSCATFNQVATAVQSPGTAGTYTPTLSFAASASTWYVGATASMAFKTAVAAVVAPYPAAVLADSPLAYWRLGESSGTVAADSSANGRTGTYTNSPTLAVAGALAGDSNTAVTFNGTNNYADMGNPLAFQINTASLEAWVKTTTPGTGYRGVLAKTSAYGIYLKDGVLITYDYGASVDRSTGRNIADGLWHHVVLDVNSGVTSGSTIYIDGVSVLAFTCTVASHATALDVAAYSSANFMAGSVDECAFYGAPLGATRVAAHYAAAAAAAPANSAAFLAFF